MIPFSEQTQGRWMDILTGLGMSVECLVNKHTDCPLCGGAKKFRFDNKQGKGTFICTCSAGDGAALAMEYFGWDFKTLAKEVKQIIGECRMNAVVPANKDKQLEQNRQRLKRIQAGLKPITPETVVGKYLKDRGLNIPRTGACRSHDGIAYYEGNQKIGEYPAMVSTIVDKDGSPVSFQVVYLTNEGTKLACESPKKILPVIREWDGGAIRLFEAGEILAITEGVETALAVHQDKDIPVWAAVSANGMGKIIIPKCVKLVLIYPDEDKSFTGQAKAYELARRLKVVNKLDVEVRRLMSDGDITEYADRGLDMDYLDWINLAIK